MKIQELMNRAEKVIGNTTRTKGKKMTIDFHDFDSNFDRQFNQTRRLAITGIIISAIAGLSFTGFLIWVIIKLLAHFGVM